MVFGKNNLWNHYNEQQIVSSSDIHSEQHLPKVGPYVQLFVCGQFEPTFKRFSRSHQDVISAHGHVCNECKLQHLIATLTPSSLHLQTERGPTCMMIVGQNKCFNAIKSIAWFPVKCNTQPKTQSVVVLCNTFILTYGKEASGFFVHKHCIRNNNSNRKQDTKINSETSLSWLLLLHR